MTQQPTWDLRSIPTAKLLDMLHEYSQAHAAVSDKSYEHPDSAHYQAHFYNLRWAVARELERRGYKAHIMPLVAKSLSDTEHLLLHRPPVDREYLLAKSLGPGERWITVHPHGDAEPGIPVLIQERPDGTAHVIGGAGGSLNFVRLTNLKTPKEYREQAKAKAQQKRAEERERVAGLSPEERDAEAKQKEQIAEARRSTEDQQVAKVYQMMGKEVPQLKDPEALAKENGTDVAAAKIAIARERRAHVAAVHQLADLVRQTLVNDHEMAAQAGLGDISLSSAADQELWGTGESKVSMDLLQPDKARESSGIKSDFKPRAESAGGTRESVKEESKLIRERNREHQDQEQKEFQDRIAANMKAWNEQAKQLEESGAVKGDLLKVEQLPEPAKMLDILKADQAIQQAGKNAREQTESVKNKEFVNPYVVDTNDALEPTIVKQMVNEVELKAVRGMLSRLEDEQGLTKHVRNAAFDTLNQVGLTLSGAELMGREVVDFLGPAGAAQLLAQRLRQTLTDEDYDAVATAISEMHGRNNAAQAEDAMKRADEELNLARQLEIGTASEPMDVIAARALNDQRMEHLQRAREIMGDSYGRLTAMGFLSMALKGATKEDKELRVDMGGVPREQAITMARSFGLNPEVSQEEADERGVDTEKIGHVGSGDYRIDASGGKTYITLKPSALGKVVAAFDPKDTQAYADAQAVKRGQQDEEGWLPAGFKKDAGMSMDGTRIKQQRAVRLALQNRRLGLHMGAGSGKTPTAIGTFTEMHAKGMAKKAVFAVPSAVQAQFGSEMDKFMEPGKYNYLADPKASREERFAAYADDKTHMVVVTHQGFRDDLIHAVAQHTGKSPQAIQRAFGTMPPEARQQAMKAAMDKLGWKVDFLGVDEAHGILNRQGKPDSSTANAIDSFSYHMPNYLSMTGTPVKNDASEAFDVLAKLDPQRFTDRAAFMRKYGVNTPTNWAALQRLMGRYVYADRISSGVERHTDERNIKLTPEQQQEYGQVMSALNKVRASRRGGKVDLEALKVIAPDALNGVPEDELEAKAQEIAKVGLGGRLNARLQSIVNGAPYEHNAKINAMREDLQAHKDQPHVIFAHHYQSVGHIKRLCDELGMKVGVISGDMSAAEKAKVRKGFQPEDGSEPQHDVLLCTDAGSTGQNLQRGTILMNYDTPDTAMCHEQRNARIDRLGQTQNVTIRDYVTDTPIERKARKRLEDKYALSDVFQSPSEMLDDTGLAGEIQRVRAERGTLPTAKQHAAQAQDDHFAKIKAAVADAKPGAPAKKPAEANVQQVQAIRAQSGAQSQQQAQLQQQQQEPVTQPKATKKPKPTLADAVKPPEEPPLNPRQQAEQQLQQAQTEHVKAQEAHRANGAALDQEWKQSGKQPAGYEQKTQQSSQAVLAAEKKLRDAEDAHGKAIVAENVQKRDAEKKAEAKARKKPKLMVPTQQKESA